MKRPSSIPQRKCCSSWICSTCGPRSFHSRRRPVLTSVELPENVSVFSVHSDHAPTFLPSAKSPSRSLLLLRSNHDHVPVRLPWSYVPWTRGIFLSRQIVNAPSSLPFGS